MTGRDRLAAPRRALQLALGVMWLIDAALQFQPYMFTRAFPREILAPVGPGNPVWVAGPVHWSAHLTASHVAVLNAAFATTQLLIALGLFTRPTVRIALLGSVAWGLGVWWMGEGLGGLLVEPQSPVMGAPGAALLYAVIAVLLWPPREPVTVSGPVSVATTGPVRGLAARLVWAALWFGFAAESLQAANRSQSGLHDLVAGMRDGEPGWLQSVNRSVANALAGHGLAVSVAIAVGCVVIGLAVFAGTRILRIALVLAVGFAAAIWVVGQDFGEIATGAATDVNTGPLLMLLAAVYWPLRPRPAVSSTGSTTVTVESLPRDEVAVGAR